MKLSQINLVHLTLAGIFLLAAARVSPDPDTWWHLRAGQWMIENRELLRQDLFSYTRLGQPWEVPGWPVEIGMYLIYRLSGLGGLNLATGVIFTLTFFVISRILAGEDLLQAIALLLGAAVSSLHASARPALLTLLFTAIFLWVLEDYRWGRSRRLWLLPLIMVAWANSHGLFFVGIGLIVLYAIGMTKVDLEGVHLRIRTVPFAIYALIPILLVSACLNPYGLAMLTYPLRAASAHWGAIQNIQEWQSPDFHRAFIQPFVWLLLLTFGAAGACRKRLALVDFLLLSIFAYLGLYSARNLALFGLAAPVVLARCAAPLAAAWTRKHPTREKPRPRWRSVLVWSTLSCLVLLGVYRVVQGMPETVNLSELEKAGMIPPPAVLETLRSELPDGRLFNSYDWGGYLQWALPEYPLFVDGRADLFKDEIIDQWFQVALVKDGWNKVLDRWGIDTVFIERSWPIGNALEQAGWEKLYQDNKAVIYRR